MKWFDFNDPLFLTFFIITIVVIVFLLLVFLSMFYFTNTAIKRKEGIKNESNAPRVYVLDIKKNSVVYFDKNHVKRKIRITVPEFYSRYSEKDQEIVREWIMNICIDPSKVAPFLEVDVVFKNKKASFSLLKFVSFNNEELKIHLESVLLKYIVPTGSTNKSNTSVVNYSKIKEIVNKNKTVNGYSFNIHFYDSTLHPFSSDNEAKVAIFTLKNALYRSYQEPNRPRYVYQYDERNIIISDISFANNDEALVYEAFLSSILTKEIGIFGYDDSLRYSIGIIKHENFYQDFDSIQKNVLDISLVAEQSNKDYLFFEKSAQYEVREDKYLNEIDSILKTPGIKIHYMYQPILDVKNKKVYGYNFMISFTNSLFISYFEMMKYAYKTNKIKDVYSLIIREAMPKFINEVDDKKKLFFIPTSIYDLPYIDDIVHQIKDGSTIKTIFVLRDNDLLENDDDKLKSILASLKMLGYHFGLYTTSKTNNVDDALYNLFDYFLTSHENHAELNTGSIFGLKLRTLIESLLKYKKPILAVNLDSWKEVELIVKSGVLLVSSNVIAEYSEMILPLSKKKIEKTVAMDR